MTATPERLVRLLADGATRSGTDLAESLGLTRAAVSKAARQLETLGIEVIAEKGRGYRLPHPLELLDADAIRASLGAECRQCLQQLDVMWSLSSTNDFLLEAGPSAAGRGRACLAEFQTAGRGRRGRPWFAQAGHGISLSLAWSFASAPAQLGSLPLAAGIAIRRAAMRCGAEDVQLKWPNDVLISGAKLAGILIDLRGEAGGPLNAVIGVGLNYRLAPGTEKRVLESGGVAPATLVASQSASLSRNAVAAAMIEALTDVLREYGRAGFSAFASEWHESDYLQGQEVIVDVDGELHRGRVHGVAADGRLQLMTDSGVMHFMSGDVRVRLQEQRNSE